MSVYLQTVSRHKISEAERSRKAGLLSESEFQLTLEKIRKEYQSDLAQWERVNEMRLAIALRDGANLAKGKAASANMQDNYNAPPKVEAAGQPPSLNLISNQPQSPE